MRHPLRRDHRIGVVHGREWRVVSNDATSRPLWCPKTITKICVPRKSRCGKRIPIIYLVDSAGVNCPIRVACFRQYGAARIFYYNSLMRRYLHGPVAAVMGSAWRVARTSLRSPM